ncbi:toxin-antitoxin system YwqK family antitoxin [Fulvivirgaceae bacterium BMA10]|uniref:Toxin-antitoxin system YwqK family antitoxin n=1 Tax=Splendidivirga corallicola TaxID=3051826 RepID=A0ABT8KPE4_9BACT|nr:toxin-antitoxin system YwqK family antitoxin [Fulvivirgaceae bacterium BMA10]
MLRRLIFPFLLCMCHTLCAQITEDRYDNGKLRAVGRMENGLKVGEWKYYYPDGTKNAVEFYQKDQLHGSCYYYSFAGNLIGYENWKNGIQVDSAKYFYDNGIVEKEGVFQAGSYQGEWVFYYENGKVKRKGTYQKGLPNGTWLFYYENGNIKQEGKFLNGMEEDEWKFYNEQGRLEYIGSYESGQRIGEWFYITKKGKKKPISIDDN